MLIFTIEKFAYSIYEISVISKDQIRMIAILTRKDISNKFNREKIRKGLVYLYSFLLEKLKYLRTLLLH